ncbi:MAG: class I SAM-dependent methyltransferase [Bacteroidetes bacterium]|nr:class I SAM-dependent methyltransferase [Bacteroidota bacterium]
MLKLKENPLMKLFIENKVIKTENLKLYHQGTRDVDEINVCIDVDSGSLILDKNIEQAIEYYNNNKAYSSKENKTLAKDTLIDTIPLEDDYRRCSLFSGIIKDKKILDFGCGKGGFLRCVKDHNISNEVLGIELNRINRDNINKYGIECVESINESKGDFDFIFLYHVFEHLENPIRILEQLLSLLKKDGNIIMEIPHGNDFLIKESKILSFRNFTFWSEHLCLYTKPLLENIFDVMKIEDYLIICYQRYNMNNHFYWFKENKPGGHKESNLFNNSIDKCYKKFLVESEKSDTLYIFIGPDREEISHLI